MTRSATEMRLRRLVYSDAARRDLMMRSPNGEQIAMTKCLRYLFSVAAERGGITRVWWFGLASAIATVDTFESTGQLPPPR